MHPEYHTCSLIDFRYSALRIHCSVVFQVIYTCLHYFDGLTWLGLSHFQKNAFYVAQFMCAVTSYALNFFIYIFTSPPLRKHFLRTVCFWDKKRRAASNLNGVFKVKSSTTQSTISSATHQVTRSPRLDRVAGV